MAGNKHRVTRDALEALIETLSVGDALPPERTLAAELQVSRMTLRGVLDDLLRLGRITRRQGAGTFVAEPKIAQTLTVTSFSEDMRSRGLTPSSVSLGMERLTAGPSLGAHLHLADDEGVLRLTRLRLADGIPMAIETLHVPADLVPGLVAADLENASFYELIAERYDLHLARGTQVIEPTVTDAEVSALLRRPLRSPAFLFERTSWDTTGRVVEFVRSIYPGDRYKLTANLQVANTLEGAR